MRISDWSSDVCSSDLRAEAVARHGVAVEAHPAQSRVDGVFAHWALAVPDARKDELPAAGQGLQLAQDLHGLSRQRHDVLRGGLGRDVAPLPGAQELGRATGGERGGTSVEIMVCGGSMKKKKK